MRTAMLFLLLIVLAAGARYANEHPPARRPPASSGISVVVPPQAVWSRPRSPDPSAAPTLDAAPAAVAEVPAGERLSEGAVDRACKMPPVKPVEQAEPPVIHRWIDADGRVQFSDKRPAHAGSARYEPRIALEKRYFDVAISYQGMRSVPFLKDRLRSEVTKMYEILALLVGESRLRRVELNIRVFEHEEDYNAYASRVSARLANTGGFYSLARNEAVTYRHRSDDATHATVRHEAMHVIAAGLFGRIPTWLNEGLAEYFEVLSVEDQRVTIRPQQRWLEMAAQVFDYGYPTELRTYLELSEADWYRQNRDAHYALAWSLVHFLMSSERGRAAVGSYLQELADHYCEPVDGLAWLERSYPGGYAGFAGDFEDWLALGRAAAHTH